MLSPMAGCIRHFSTNMSDFQNLSLTALLPFTTDARLLVNNHSNVFIPWMTSVRNCLINGTIPNSNAAIGNVGVLLGQAGLLENTQVNGAWMGVRLAGQNIKISCCTFEVNCYAVVIGGLELGDPFGANAGAGNFTIENLEMEGTYGAAIAADTAALNGLISNVVVTANHQNTCYGLYLGSASGTAGLTVQNCQFIGSPGAGANSFGGYWNPSFAGGAGGVPAAVFIGSNTNPRSAQRKVFIAIQAIATPGTYVVTNGYKSNAWVMPTFPDQAEFVNCNNPPAIFPYNNIMGAQTGIAGYISNGTSGVAGNILTITSFSQAARAGYVGAPISPPIGSLITGTGIAANTFITSATVTGTGPYIVNNSQAAGTSGSPVAITIYPMVDGDEYLISDSTVPYTPQLPTDASTGSWTTSSTAITMAATIPAYILGGMNVFNDTTNLQVGTVLSTSGVTLTLTAVASSAGSAGDTLIFTPLSNIGRPIIIGGGNYHIKMRWNSAQQNWLLV